MTISPPPTPPARFRLRPRFLWQIPVAVLTLGALLISTHELAVARDSRRTKDIPYQNEPSKASSSDAERHRLDVYTPNPRSKTGPYPVVVFIHGGSWNSGNKNLYSFIGRRLAKQGIVAVIPNYRLAPNVLVPGMADDCVQAVRWVTQHIADYGGNPARLFIMGHSAGGGLAALLATDDRLFNQIGLTQNPIKGAILDDPAGLDMLDYLTKMEYPNDEQYLVPFGRDPAVWRAMSALYHVRAGSPPMLMYVGARTYPSIRNSTQKFRERLQTLGVPHEFRLLPGKKHIGMVTQLYWSDNRMYQDLQRFIAAESPQGR